MFNIAYGAEPLVTEIVCVVVIFAVAAESVAGAMLSAALTVSA